MQTVQTATFSPVVSISKKNLYPCDGTTLGFNLSLPAASTAGNGATVYFKKIDASANAITINAAGSDKIDGASSISISSQYQIIGLTSDGVSAWEVITFAASVFTGDSGSGGSTGLVPAPAAGTSAKRYVLGAGGSFVSQTCVQHASFESGAVATGTGTFSQNDVIPTNVNGDEYMTLVFTPLDIANKLVIDVRLFAASSQGSGNAQIVGALFQDAVVNTLAVGATCNAANNNLYGISFQHIMAAGTISATTFRVRIGGTTSGTTTFNGVNGTRLWGGVIASSITITEFKE